MKLSRRGMLGVGVGAVGAAAAAYGASQVFGAGADLAAGRSRARRVPTSPKPPARADVVVIGGGNLGAAAAYYLARDGLSVVLCEKGAIGGEASCRSVGQVFSLGTEPAKLPLVNAAKALWPSLNAELQEETGFRQTGLVMEVPNEAEREFWLHWIKEAAPHSGHATLLSAPEAQARVTATRPWAGGILEPTDGCAEPILVAAAFALAAQRHGAVLAAPCAVRGIETAAGRISGVVTEHGPISTQRVVCAGGAWASAFFHNAGLHLPIGDLFSWCASFYGVDGPEGAGNFKNVTWRRQIDGGYTTSIQSATAPLTPKLLRDFSAFAGARGRSSWDIRPRLGRYFFEELRDGDRWKLDEVSPFERRRILEPALNGRVIEAALQTMRDDIPAFRNLKVGDAWGGVLSSTPDALPVLGPVPSIPGMLVAAGFADGLTLAPAAGKAIADLVAGRTTDVDLRAFRFDRFN